MEMEKETPVVIKNYTGVSFPISTRLGLLLLVLQYSLGMSKCTTLVLKWGGGGGGCPKLHRIDGGKHPCDVQCTCLQTI